jgi:hypothetical protein
LKPSEKNKHKNKSRSAVQRQNRQGISAELSTKNGKIYIKHWQLFTFLSLALLLAHSLDFKFRVSTDGYTRAFLNDPSGELLHGRFLNFLVQMFYDITKINIVYAQQVFFFLFIAILAASGCLLIYSITKYLSPISPLKFALLTMAVLISFCNIAFQEYFFFSEVYLVWGLGALFTALALFCFDRLPLLKGSLVATVLMLASMNIYQIWLQYFVIFGFLLLILRYKKICKPIFLQSLRLGAIAIFSLAANMLMLGIAKDIGATASTTRDISAANIPDNLYVVLKAIQSQLLEFPYAATSALLVTILLLSCVAIIAVISWGPAWVSNQQASALPPLSSTRGRLNLLALLAIFLLLAWLVTYGIHVFEANPWVVTRTITGLGYLVTALLILLIALSSGNRIGQTIGAGRTPSHRIEIAMTVCIIALLALCIYQSQSITSDQLANNKLDEAEVLALDAVINNYEKESGERVTKLVRTFDSSSLPRHAELHGFNSGDVNLRALYVDWSFAPVFEFYTGRKFETFASDEQAYQKFFAGKDWDTFNPSEQLIFVGDTAYLCLY